jgi:replicative DNA helicase
MERQKRIATGGSTAFIKTGISDLDKKVCIERSDYIIIGARPSNGKSSLAGVIGRNVCRAGGVVYVFYLDTAKEVEVSRAVFSEARLSLSDFNSGFLRNKDCSSIGKAFETLNPMRYYLDDTPRITPDQINAKCQRLISIEGKIDLIIIDFLQNVRAPINNIRERVSYVSEELHNLPREINCPVIALSQMARYQNEEKEAPTLKVLKESGDIEEDADKVLLLYYPEHYKYTNEKSDKKNLMEVYIAKNKNGCVGYVPLNFFASTFEINNRSTSNEF